MAIPVFANGDIMSCEKACAVLAQTVADAVMIERAARGRPWIFCVVDHFLRTGSHLAPRPLALIHDLMRRHFQALHVFYGDVHGVGFAHKHCAWYLESFDGAREFS